MTAVPATHQRNRGFTLVELLLALTLMSMLLALAYGGLRASTRAADKGQTILEDSGRIRMAHQFVRKQMNQMTPLAFGESESGGQGPIESQRMVFVGEAQRIRYVAPMPGYLGFGGPQVQELALIRGADGLELVLSHALLQDFEEQKLYEREPIVLITEIDTGEFSFLGRDENDELMSWTTAWEDSSKLPESVALDIGFNEKVYIKWPLLTASVRIDSGALEDLVDEDPDSPNYSKSIRDLINNRKRD